MNAHGMLVLTRGDTRHRTLTIAALAAAAAVLLLLPHLFVPYRVFQFSEVLIYAIAVLSLNVLTGYTGQISLGHSFFFAIGAYTTTIMIVHGSPYAAAAVIASAAAFLMGFLVGIPALRLHDIYLALITVAVAVATPPLIKRFEPVTGGSQGLGIDKPAAPAWTGLAEDQWLYYLCLAAAVAVFAVTRNLLRGGVGRAMLAVRDHELAARTMGVHPARIKTLAFAVSGGFAGIAGSLYALVVGYVSPGSFEILLAVYLLVGAVVGGLSTIWGAVLGAAFIVYVPIYTADVSSTLGGVVYGLTVVAIMLVLPGGAMGLLHRLRTRLVTVAEPGPPPNPPAGPRATAGTGALGGTAPPDVTKGE